MCCLIALAALSVIGCKDETTNPPTTTPPGTLTATPSSVTTNAGTIATVTIRGGVKPYSIMTQPDTTFATASLSDSTLTITAKSNGSTSVRVKDNDTSKVTINIAVTGAITLDLFPVVVGHKYTYTGYATAAGSGAQIPDPTGSYKTVWTIAATGVPSPIGGAAGVALVDSTTGPFGPGGFVVTVARTLLIRKDATTGDLEFLQTIGPFKRAFGIPIPGTAASDTLIWAAVARPSTGLSGQWLAFDQTFTGTGSTQVRLEIKGTIDSVVTVRDSSAAHTTYTAYRSRTWRKITVGGTVVQDDATTSRLWLAPFVGPVQVRIVEDTENLGHFRVIKAKNF